jgi:hypothetical protein
LRHRQNQSKIQIYNSTQGSKDCMNTKPLTHEALEGILRISNAFEKAKRYTNQLETDLKSKLEYGEQYLVILENYKESWHNMLKLGQRIISILESGIDQLPMEDITDLLEKFEGLGE